MFIVEHPGINAINPRSENESDPDETAALESVKTERTLEQFMYSAKWTVAVTLAGTVSCMTLLTVLSHSLDRPGTKKIDNRFMRMAGRLGVVVLALCLPVKESMSGSTMIGIDLAALGTCSIWEWAAAVDKDGGFIER